MLNVYLSVSVLVISCLCFSYSVLASNNEQNIYGTAVDTHTKIGLTEDSTYSYVSQNSGINGNQNGTNKMYNSNLYSNPPFIFLDNNSATIRLGLPSFWKDQKSSCSMQFECESDFSTGWNDKTSFRVTSADNVNRTRAMFYGKSIEVTPQKQYQFVSHMKLNEWARQSRVTLEGFDENTRQWKRIQECPSGVNGPIDWKEYNCHVLVPQNTTKIRPVLNAGYSADKEEQAVTWFDTIYVIRTDNPFAFSGGLKAELVYRGLNRPSSMEFLGVNDILVTEKNTGKVIEIKNGANRTLLDLNVAVLGERGLLGIAVTPKPTTNQEDNDKEAPDNESNTVYNSNEDKYVFLYFTEAKNHDGDDKEGNDPIGNRLYRYELVDNTLKNPKLILDLPAGYHHNGGKILAGDDGDLYIAIGELDDISNKAHKSNRALNFKGEAAPDGRGGILRINYDGDGINGGIIGDEAPLDKYYAYGIRNSFGLDFDPVTGKLWDTENGPTYGDEVNLVEPGFNSGWRNVQGMWSTEADENEGVWLPERPGNLEDFDGKGKYSTPEFAWKKTVGPTALKFLTTDKLGEEYENDMLVSDVSGRVYHFDLNENRAGLLLDSPLKNKVAENNDEFNSAVFFEGQGTLITDLDIGPDGYLYLLDHTGGKIYRISNSAKGGLLNYLDEASRSAFTAN
jgi:aldose sugar dehydrogenase